MPTWSGTDIFDLSYPEQPALVYTIPAHYDYSDVKYDGEWLYAVYSNILDIWDVSDPSLPMFVSRCATENHPSWRRVAAGNGHAYAASASWIHSVDIADPANPVYHDRVFTEGIIQDLTVADSTLYAANWYYGVAMFDTSTADLPIEIGHYDNAAHARCVSLSDGYAYLTGYRRDIQVIDVSTPSDPQRAHSLDVEAWRVSANADRAYIVQPGEPGAFVLADILDSGELDIRSEVALPQNAYDVVVEGDYAYVVVYNTGVAVIEISNPDIPVVRGICPVNRPERIALQYPYAYVAGGFSYQWHVLDVSDPENPFVVQDIDSPLGAHSVLVAGDLLFVSRRRGVEIFSLSTPDSPTWLGDFSLEYGSDVVDLVFANNRLYMLPRLAVIDVSDPTEPRLVGEHFRGTAYASGIEFDGRYVYAANDSTGLSVFKISLVGDFDDDGFVSQSDLLVFLGHYGTCLGDVDYSDAADFDDSGCINLSDLAEFLSLYGNQR